MQRASEMSVCVLLPRHHSYFTPSDTLFLLRCSISNFFLPDETLNSWLDIPWRVYVAIIEGSAAETDGDSNWLAKLSSIIGVLVGVVLIALELRPIRTNQIKSAVKRPYDEIFLIKLFEERFDQW